MHEPLEPELEALLLRIIPGLEAQWAGADSVEIADLAKIAGRPLPPFYCWFLRTMGSSLGPAAYPTMDFSAKRILRCYRDGVVEADPQFLLIGYESNDAMPLHYFYDLDQPARGDALVFRSLADGGDMHLGFETFREMLAWGKLFKHRIHPAKVQCEGTFFSGDSPLVEQLDPIMRRHGFLTPVPTGNFCALFETDEMTLICKATPEDGPQHFAFDVGATSEPEVRRVLGSIATGSDIAVKVAQWSSASP